MGVNSINIIGHLGQDPELKEVNGMSICTFSVAVSDKVKDKETTEWFRVTAFGNQAKSCHQYLAKGRQVYVQGKVKINRYTGKDGVERAGLEITASNVSFLGGGQEKSNVPAKETMKEAIAKAEFDASNIPF